MSTWESRSVVFSGPRSRGGKRGRYGAARGAVSPASCLSSWAGDCALGLAPNARAAKARSPGPRDSDRRGLGGWSMGPRARLLFPGPSSRAASALLRAAPGLLPHARTERQGLRIYALGRRRPFGGNASWSFSKIMCRYSTSRESWISSASYHGGHYLPPVVCLDLGATWSLVHLVPAELHIRLWFRISLIGRATGTLGRVSCAAGLGGWCHTQRYCGSSGCGLTRLLSLALSKFVSQRNFFFSRFIGLFCPRKLPS